MNIWLVFWLLLHFKSAFKTSVTLTVSFMFMTVFFFPNFKVTAVLFFFYTSIMGTPYKVE